VIINGSPATVARWGNLNKIIYMGHEDGSISTWDPVSGEKLQSVRAHTARVQDMQFSEDKSYFVTASKDASARVFDAKTLKELKNFKTHANVNSASVSPTHEYVRNRVWTNMPVAVVIKTCGPRLFSVVVKKRPRSQQQPQGKESSRCAFSTASSTMSSAGSRAISVPSTLCRFIQPEEDLRVVVRTVMFVFTGSTMTTSNSNTNKATVK
jgi:WD40 repeat protein